MKISRSKTLDLTITLQYETEPHDDIGDLFTTEEFEEMCKDGCFINFDGYGYYATADYQTNIVIVPSNVYKSVFDNCKVEYEEYKQLKKHFTHVKWYNR